MNRLINLSVNFKKHNNMYIMLTISISIFFVFCQLIVNESIVNKMITIDHTLPIWMKALVSIISIFSFIYYRYLILYIIEEKLKDYGVLISLGCNKDKIKYKVYKLLAKYTCITLIIGLSIGSILYYGVLALINGTNLEKVSSHLSIIGYVIVIIIYLIIYIVNIKLINNKIKYMDISDMLYYKKVDKSINKPQVYQNIGVGLLIMGLVLLIISKSQDEYGFFSALIPMVFFIGSAYFLTQSFPYWFIILYTSRNENFLNNLFFISQLRTNYKKYANLLTACTIIIIFGLFMLIANINMGLSNNINAFEKPFEFVLYIDSLDDKILSKIDNFKANANERISNEQLVNIMRGNIQWDDDEYNNPIDIISENTYSKLSGKSLSIKKGDIVLLSQLDRNFYNISVENDRGIEWSYQPPGKISYLVNDKIYYGNITKEIWEIVYNIPNQSMRTYIISDSDYDQITKNIKHIKAQYFVNTFRVEDNNDIYELIKDISHESKIETKSYELQADASNKYIVSILILICILMLMSSLISLMLLKIQQTLNDEKLKYINLYTLGYNQFQLKKEIKKEMAVLFFMPLIIGGSISILYIIFSMYKLDYQLLIIFIYILPIILLVEYSLYFITSTIIFKFYFNCSEMN